MSDAPLTMTTVLRCRYCYREDATRTVQLRAEREKEWQYPIEIGPRCAKYLRDNWPSSWRLVKGGAP